MSLAYGMGSYSIYFCLSMFDIGSLAIEIIARLTVAKELFVYLVSIAVRGLYLYAYMSLAFRLRIAMLV